MWQSQRLIMASGAGLMLLGVLLYFFYPITGECTSPISLRGSEFCLTSPGTICVMVGAALLVIGFLGMAFLESRNNN